MKDPRLSRPHAPQRRALHALVIWLTVVAVVALPAQRTASAATDVNIGVVTYIDIDGAGDAPATGDIVLAGNTVEFFEAPDASGPWTATTLPDAHTTSATRTLSRRDILDLGRVDPTGWLVDEGDHIAACLEPNASIIFSHIALATSLVDPTGAGRDCARYQLDLADTGYSFAFAVELVVMVDVGVTAFDDLSGNGVPASGDFAVPGIEFDLYEADAASGTWTAIATHSTTVDRRLNRDDVREIDLLDPTGWIAEEGDTIAVCMNPHPTYTFDNFGSAPLLPDPTGAGRPCAQDEIAPRLRPTR